MRSRVPLSRSRLATTTERPSGSAVSAESAKKTAKPVAVAANSRRWRRMKRRNRSIGGPYVGTGDDGRRPSTAESQLAELVAPDEAGLGDDGAEDDFAGADEDSDVDDVEFEDEPFELEPLPARRSVR